MDRDEEIEQLLAIRSYATKRLNALRLTGYQADRRRVSAAPLIPVIRQWIDSGKSLTLLSATVLISDRTLRRILTGDLETILDDTADKFFTRLGLPHIYDELFPPEPPPSQYYEE